MEILNTYTDLHRLAEPPLEEYKTSAYLKEKLQELGFTIRNEIETGIIAEYDSGNDGAVVALRADMDALAYEIDGKTVYKHCCGHDANMTMVLHSAKNIIEHKITKGKLVIVFQPAEEVMKGAKFIAESGLIDDVEIMFGVHLRPIAEAKMNEAVPALCHGSSYTMKVDIHGINSHAARPHLGVNAIELAALFINAVNSIKLDPRIAHSAKVTIINGGITSNIIPNKVSLTLDLRAQTNELMQQMIDKIKKILTSITELNDTTYEITHLAGCYAAEYDDELIEMSKEAITEVLGSSLPVTLTPGGEDFHFYKQILNLRCCYIGIGADLAPGLHNYNMDFNKGALKNGANILTKIALKLLA